MVDLFSDTYPHKIEAMCVNQSKMAQKSWRGSGFGTISSGYHKTRRSEKRHEYCAFPYVERNKNALAMYFTVVVNGGYLLSVDK